MILDINYNLNKLADININITNKGFVLKYKSIDYIITLHNYCPVNANNIKITCENNNNLMNEAEVLINEAEILINSSWNELLILKCNIQSNYKQIKKIKLALPSINNKVYCNNNILIVDDYNFISLNFLPIYPRILYIKLKNDNNGSLFPGLPVFQKNKKLIGIISHKVDDYVYIIPTYYIIKTLEKQCNNNIFTFDYNSIINKINKYNVSNNQIYHPSLLINMPLDVYFTLEGDKEKILKINDEYFHMYSELNFTNLIGNQKYIIKKNNNYILNVSLLTILKIINNRIVSDFISFLQSHLDKIIFLNVQKLKSIKYYRLLKRNNLLYEDAYFENIPVNISSPFEYSLSNDEDLEPYSNLNESNESNDEDNNFDTETNGSLSYDEDNNIDTEMNSNICEFENSLLDESSTDNEIIKIIKINNCIYKFKLFI